MSFFDDPFEEVLSEFFDRSGVNRVRRKEEFITNEEEERTVDFIESPDKVYLLFELPGYSEKDIIVQIKGNTIEINAKRSGGKEEVQEYLIEKLQNGSYINKNLPEIVDLKKFSYSIRNGVLEIIFEKKK